jgi:alcohol dehydrogenase class IV
MVAAPHGAVCAALLPGVVAANVRALRERAPESAALPRYDKVGRLLTGDASATAADAVAWLRQLVTDLRISGLGVYGVGSEHIDELVGNAAAASSMKANPVELTRDELAAIVEAAR